jgi:hypothetical protein
MRTEKGWEGKGRATAAATSPSKRRRSAQEPTPTSCTREPAGLRSSATRHLFVYQLTGTLARCVWQRWTTTRGMQARHKIWRLQLIDRNVASSCCVKIYWAQLKTTCVLCQIADLAPWSWLRHSLNWKVKKRWERWPHEELNVLCLCVYTGTCKKMCLCS